MESNPDHLIGLTIFIVKKKKTSSSGPTKPCESLIFLCIENSTPLPVLFKLYRLKQNRFVSIVAKL